MNDARVTIHLQGNGRAYEPGERLAGQYRLHSLRAGQIKAIEVSVLWHTEGKGSEDLAVHHFRRLSAEHGGLMDPRQPGRFSTTLPNSPLTYQGVIVKLRWCVRVRVFLSGGREVVGQKTFRLGHVPSAKVAI